MLTSARMTELMYQSSWIRESYQKWHFQAKFDVFLPNWVQGTMEVHLTSYQQVEKSLTLSRRLKLKGACQQVPEWPNNHIHNAIKTENAMRSVIF